MFHSTVFINPSAWRKARSSAQSQQTPSYGVTAADIKTDLAPGKGRPEWVFSSYGPGKNAPRQLFGGPQREQSFEEMRLRHYEAAAAGNPAPAIQEAEALYAECLKQMDVALSDADGAVRYVVEGEKEHPNRVDITEGRTGPATAGQGGAAFSQSSSGFGQPTALGESQSAFGKPTGLGQQSAFGQPAFGQPSFGQASAPAQKPAFGQPSGLGAQGSAFGQPSSLGSSQSAFGKPAFGQPSFGQSGFSQPAFGKPSGPSPFGQAPSAASGFGQPSSGPSPFGQPSGQTAATGFGQPSTSASPFGQAAQSPSPFGQVAKAENPFGQPSTTASPFGAPAQQPAPSGFGQPAATTTASPFGQPATAAAPFGQPPAAAQPPQPATASLGPKPQLKIEDPKELNPLPNLTGQTVRDPLTKKLTMWKGQPVKYIDEHPCYLHPDDRETYVHIFFPEGPPDQASLRDAQGKPEEYTPEVTEQYEFFIKNGFFKDGVIPSVPPKTEWVSFDF
ncbi:conserved hypothetical protein [Paecilomyces variotii No. 5]|uniref:CCCH zinc finger domain protein n=1 Tax=Byssochlamys spectabilis (strain No. 5 / NBRC 109023) TaxID=1356009 RepID=V5GCY7_BYSSN|nr:conserved hypothetical protein [Paecilomyces variotii No. 5]